MLRVVVDTNKVIASLLRNGKVRKLLFHPSLEILLPKYVLEEISNHIDYIRRKVPTEAIDLFLTKVPKRSIVIEPYKINKEILDKARTIAKAFDPDDYPFIAIAIEYNAIIWTNDKSLIKHGLVSNEYIAIDTISLEKLLKGENISQILERLKNRYLSNRK